MRLFFNTEETWMWIMWKIFSVWLAILIHFVQYYFFISRNVLFLPDFIISLYYARESVIAKITFEVSRIFCLQRLTNWYIHSIHKCLKPIDCPYCNYKCVRKENIYVYNIHGHKEYWCIFPWIFTNSILALCPEETWMWIMWKNFLSCPEP